MKLFASFVQRPGGEARCGALQVWRQAAAAVPGCGFDVRRPTAVHVLGLFKASARNGRRREGRDVYGAREGSVGCEAAWLGRVVNDSNCSA
jgi:hypothetical protein